MISVRPEVLDTHGSRMTDAPDVARRYATRHTAMLAECAAAWAGESAVALAELAASEATFTLHKTSTWLLWDITNDHVVPNCEASTA